MSHLSSTLLTCVKSVKSLQPESVLAQLCIICVFGRYNSMFPSPVLVQFVSSAFQKRLLLYHQLKSPTLFTSNTLCRLCL